MVVQALSSALYLCVALHLCLTVDGQWYKLLPTDPPVKYCQPAESCWPTTGDISQLKADLGTAQLYDPQSGGWLLYIARLMSH